MSENKVDVIIVGAGPAGISAAITLARSSKKVLVIERGSFAGAKNVFGGAIYIEPTKEIFPNFLEEAPIERINSEHKYFLLTDESSTTVSHKSNAQKATSCTVIRAKFDRWCMDEAQKAGAYFAPNTVVTKLIVENNNVIGVKTDYEEYFSDIVIIADGVNSLLAKQIGARQDIQSKDVALSVKEVLKLDSNIIDERFNLENNNGCICEFIGYPMDKVMGLGFLYTNKDSLSIGIGISLEDLKKYKLNANDILEKLKAHPTISSLIKNAELIEYSSHLIPEGGYNKLPKLYGNGFMIIGDAAMLVNNIHWEGTNLAMKSGQLAAETAINALNNNDFSEKSLALYQQKLKNSYVIKDLKTYRNLLNNLTPRTKSFFGYYPKKISEFFEIFTAVNSKPKKQEFKKYIKSWFTERNLTELIKDIFTILKSVIGVIK